MQIKEIWFSFVWYKNFRFDSISNILSKIRFNHTNTSFAYLYEFHDAHRSEQTKFMYVPQEIYWRHRTECSRLEKNVAGWSLNTCGLQYLSWDTVPWRMPVITVIISLWILQKYVNLESDIVYYDCNRLIE